MLESEEIGKEKKGKLIKDKISSEVSKEKELKKGSKKEAEKVSNEKESNTSKEKKSESEKVISKSKKQKEDVVSEKVDELTVIEKIKNFIAKIAKMQEEAGKEENEKNEDKELKGNARLKQPAKKDNSSETNKPSYMLEYYDLPYRYNETIVKILAQTPKRLFVYWDISDNDREKYIKTFGDDFFYKTYPVLLLYNEDKKYVKEVPINDFANSWYIEIDDPKTKYTIQLGRKFKEYPRIVNIEKIQENNIILKTDYLPFANSNVLEVPNDHVLLENLPRYITFRNVKTNQEVVKELKSFKDVFGNNYDVKEFYHEQYKEEISEGMFDMANPSSRVNSSMFK